eukprot:3713706-Lingulodinium_polyedra.AAC.1
MIDAADCGRKRGRRRVAALPVEERNRAETAADAGTPNTLYPPQMTGVDTSNRSSSAARCGFAM